MKALILTGRNCQAQEFIYPLYRLQEAGYEVDVAVRGEEKCHPLDAPGIKIEPTMDIPSFRDRINVTTLADKDERHVDGDPIEHQLLIIPGGIKAMEHMRLDREAVKLVADFHASGRVIGCICSGAFLLISAGLCKGRKIATYPAWREDVENAGGTFVNDVVTDDRIVTAPHYRDAGRWMAAVLRECARPIKNPFPENEGT